MEIQAPSIQRQQMAEIEKSTEAAAQITARQTQTTNVHGDTMNVVTTTDYESQTFASKTDWRIRAISTQNIPLRLQHTFVTNEDVREELPTYVLAKNIMKAFVSAGDLRTPILGYLFGAPAEDAPSVIEVKAVAIVPQRFSQRTVELPNDLPKHELLKDMKIIGLIQVRLASLTYATALAKQRAFRPRPHRLKLNSRGSQRLQPSNLPS